MEHAIKHNEHIDLIRGLSILAVILLHINSRNPFKSAGLGKLLPHTLYNILFFSGYYAVVVFFVVSGYLITSSIIDKWGAISNIKVKKFYLLRFSRIFPCLILLLIILTILDLLHVKGFIIHTTTLPHALFAALTFHINWLEAKLGYLPGSWDVLWSLSVEEVFYFIFPLLCLTVRNEFVFRLLLIVFIILGPLARVGFTHNDIWSDHSYLSCSDGIVMGCLAALYSSKIQLSKYKMRAFFILGTSLFMLVFVFRGFVYDSGITKLGLNVSLLEAGIAFILISISQNSGTYKSYTNKMTTIFRWFGRNSYETYLTHMFIIILAARLFYAINLSYYNLLLWYGSMLMFTGLLGGLVAYYYSIPLNKFIRKNVAIQRT